ncbi:unnamed protein product [Arctia plantaginis]|uniref:Uncharacterized protein n=1 Tax=Arctia plantaginis TaxID=874455 RepID=A0A8S1BRQ7_ARCPL|nr:unnamed protein product [Arctia plantaginis]
MQSFSSQFHSSSSQSGDISSFLVTSKRLVSKYDIKSTKNGFQISNDNVDIALDVCRPRLYPILDVQ